MDNTLTLLTEGLQAHTYKEAIKTEARFSSRNLSVILFLGIVQRMPWEHKRIWETGEYTLLIDSHTTRERVTCSRGETLFLKDKEATRLGNAGIVASPSSMHAVRARVESGRGTRRDEYLYHMWKLSGVWQD